MTSIDVLNLQTATSLEPTGITFSPGIFINGKTGNVTIPEGLSLDDASRAFWNAVAANFPTWCKNGSSNP